MKPIEYVTIEKHPRVDPMKMKNYVQLRGSDGNLFYNKKDHVRMWKTPGGAKAFLRRISDRYYFAYVVTNLTGSTSLIGLTRQEFIMVASPEQYGPHEWHKVNLVTIDDGVGGYDLWRCDLCKTETRRFGLTGRPRGDHCSANQLPEAPVDA